MALDELLDEHEQGERVRAWLRQNGPALVVGIVLGLGAIFGWKWWQQQQHDTRVAAAAEYQDAVAPLEAGDEARAALLVAGLDEPPYDTLGALRLARAQVEAGGTEAALATLRGARTDDPAMARIVQLRIARVLLETGDADGALDLLDGVGHPGALELRGDAEAALGRQDAARAAYGQAIAALEDASPQRQLLEIKLTAVGGTPPAAEPVAPADPATGADS